MALQGFTTRLPPLKKDPVLVSKFLTKYCLDNAEKNFKRWTEPGDFLITKYNDGYIQDENHGAQEVVYPEKWLKKEDYWRKKPEVKSYRIYTLVLTGHVVNSFLIIGRVGERRVISLNPARMNALGIPVHAKTGGISFSDLGSTG